MPSGDGFAGVVDTDICYDKYGLPYIPGKRVKGCLRECALEIVELEEELEDAFNLLFGNTGAAYSGALKLGSGRLKDYQTLVNEAQKHSADEVLSYYADTRTATRIEKGHSKAGSLRTFRVINCGENDQTFFFDCEFPESCETLLRRACNLLRHMGLNRTRGLGEVKCELISESKDVELGAFRISNFGDLKLLSYAMFLEEPVIMADRTGRPYGCEDYIFGSAVLGSMANLWLNNHGRPENAHENETFKKLFLSNQVFFSAAFPTDGQRIYHPTPHSLKTDKDKDKLFDECKGPYDKMEDSPICKRHGGYAHFEKDSVSFYSVRKEVSIHHARPIDKGIGHATPKDGQLFNYEAISRGQMFAGGMIGSEKDILELAQLLEKNRNLWMGRSTTAQFGKVSIQAAAFDALTPKQLSVEPGGLFRLIVRTPLIMYDEKGNDTPNLSRIPVLLGMPSLKVVKSFVTETRVAGYNSKWRLPLRQASALSEGSVIILQNGGTDRVSLKQTFIGLRCDRGFGQISLESLPDSHFNKPDLETPEVANKDDTNPLSVLIGNRQMKEDAIIRGVKYARKFRTPPQNSQLQRLKSMLLDQEIDSFAKLIDKIFEIKQEQQRLQVLSLVTNKEKRWFEISNIGKKDVIEKLNEAYFDYDEFRVLMLSVITEIKQIRRNKEAQRDDRE
jgi:CRISPR-associated protein Csx10